MSNITSDTSFYIGPGVRIEGRVTQSSKDETIVVAGVLSGDIVSDGKVFVMQGGRIEASQEIRCFEMVIEGEVAGAEVTLEAGILRLGSTARVEAYEVRLPAGGLEQTRGSVLCGRLSMGSDNAFAQDERLRQPAKAAMGSPVPARAEPQPLGALSALKVQAPSPAPAPGPVSTGSALASVVPLNKPAAPASSSPSVPSAFDEEDEELPAAKQA